MIPLLVSWFTCNIESIESRDVTHLLPAWCTFWRSKVPIKLNYLKVLTIKDAMIKILKKRIFMKIILKELSTYWWTRRIYWIISTTKHWIVGWESPNNIFSKSFSFIIIIIENLFHDFFFSSLLFGFVWETTSQHVHFFRLSIFILLISTNYISILHTILR